MNQDQLMARIKDLTMEGQALNQRYAGFMSLYNAACMSNNREEMEQHRQAVLAVIETILDNNAVQFMLVRQLGNMPPPGFPA